MNVSPTAKTILCYGDSNTWGQIPDRTGRRYPADVRWTGVLQSNLGNDYYVIEEGLSGRTIDLDYATKTGLNGRTYLEPCLDSHAPIGTVILMLGTNDLKIEFNRSMEEIIGAMRELIELIHAKTAKDTGALAKIILVSPILVNGDAPRYKEWYSDHYDESSIEKSKALAGRLSVLAQSTDCSFIDAARVAKAGQDGIHFDEESHRKLGDVLSDQLRMEWLTAPLESR